MLAIEYFHAQLKRKPIKSYARGKFFLPLYLTAEIFLQYLNVRNLQNFLFYAVYCFIDTSRTTPSACTAVEESMS